mgnify:CR=1 FL=1
MKTKPHVIRTKNFAIDAADFILEQAHKAIGERNEFRIALSGGNTPRPVYAQACGRGARPAVGSDSLHVWRRALRATGRSAEQLQNGARNSSCACCGS